MTGATAPFLGVRIRPALQHEPDRFSTHAVTLKGFSFSTNNLPVLKEAGSEKPALQSSPKPTRLSENASLEKGLTRLSSKELEPRKRKTLLVLVLQNRMLYQLASHS
jgi:hypothetical protein